MNSQFKMCRVCMVLKQETELESIYRENNEYALHIYLISGIKIMEFSGHQITAFICTVCVKNLAKAITFRNRCLESDEFFKKSLHEIETAVWSERYEKILNNEEIIDSKEQQPIIKTEPDEYPCTSVFDDTSDFFPDSYGFITKFEIDEYDTNTYVREKVQIKRRRRTTKKSENSDIDSDISWTRDENGKVKCKMCPKVFTKPHSMKCHMRAVHKKLDESDMHKCEECGKLFKLKYYLQKHLKRSHMRLKKRLKRAQGVDRLVGDDDDDDIFKEKITGVSCPMCNKFLASRHGLKDHIRVIHEFTNFDDRFICDYCGKDYTLKYYLLKHIKRTHFNIKFPRIYTREKKKLETEHPCSICGKFFKNRGNLSSHERTHRILSPSEYYYCDACGNKFKTKAEMSVHIKKRHLYKIRYPCEFCGKSWRTNYQLKKHIKVIHHNIREFKCEWCGKDFGEKNKLVAHSRIHTGEQPYQCKFCDRKFTHQTDMRRHVWGHTGRHPYKCSKDACGRGFMKRSELISHESRCHHHINSPVRPQELNVAPVQYQMI